jgi:hypothetical protein
MKKLLASTLFLFAAAANLPASVIYQFAVNTSSLSGQTGYVDFNLAPGSFPASPVTAVVSGFSTDAVFNPANVILSGDASGDLSLNLALDNGTNFNDAFQPVTFGNFVDFELILSGPGVDTPASNGSIFGFSLYDSAGINPLLTDSTDGSVAGVTIDSNDGVQAYTNPPAAGVPSVASVTSVPEPGTCLLVSLGLAAVVRRFRR